jgi:hypothetical protein
MELIAQIALGVIIGGLTIALLVTGFFVWNSRQRNEGLAVGLPLYWLVYHHNDQISVVIEPGASLIHASILPPAKRIELVTKVICAPGIGGAAWKKHVSSRFHTNVHERGLNFQIRFR